MNKNHKLLPALLLAGLHLTRPAAAQTSFSDFLPQSPITQETIDTAEANALAGKMGKNLARGLYTIRNYTALVADGAADEQALHVCQSALPQVRAFDMDPRSKTNAEWKELAKKFSSFTRACAPLPPASTWTKFCYWISNKL